MPLLDQETIDQINRLYDRIAAQRDDAKRWRAWADSADEHAQQLGPQLQALLAPLRELLDAELSTEPTAAETKRAIRLTE